MPHGTEAGNSYYVGVSCLSYRRGGHTWLHAEPWSREVKQVVSAQSSWRPFLSWSAPVGVGLHHLHNVRKLRTSTHWELQNSLGVFFALKTGLLATCEFTLKPMVASPWRAAQQLGGRPSPCSASPSGRSWFAPLPENTQPEGNTRPAGFLPHPLFRTKYTTQEVLLKTVLQRKSWMCLEYKRRK